MSYAQKVVLAFHQRLNHLGFDHVRWLAKQGYLGNRVRSALNKLSQEEYPKCATCMFGKQARRPHPKKKKYVRQSRGRRVRLSARS